MLLTTFHTLLVLQQHQSGDLRDLSVGWVWNRGDRLVVTPFDAQVVYLGTEWSPISF